MLSTDTRIEYGPTANGIYFGLIHLTEVWILSSDGEKTVFLSNPPPIFGNRNRYGGYRYYAFEFPHRVV